MKTGRILVVEDDKTFRGLLADILEGIGHEVTQAADGAAGLYALKTAPFDLVLSDLKMPVMSGIEFLRALGEEGLSRRPKVIFCTTENGIAHIRAAIDAGADEYVMKPFDRETLESKFHLVGVV